MVIFHARPSREYPILCGIIQTKYLDSFQFHEPFEIINRVEYKRQKGILNYSPLEQIPRRAYFSLPNSILTKGVEINPYLNGLSPSGNYQTLYDIKFLYGIFSCQRLNLFKNDFLFTIIEHPIEMIYNAFYYCKYITNYEHQSVLKLLCNDFFQINIKQFIDLLLQNKFNREFNFKNVKYKIIEECFYLGNLSQYNYIVFRENLERGLNILSLMVGINLECKMIPSKIIGDCTYRRSDLEKFFEKDIISYNEAKNKFCR
jgi:hypothetical protein